MSRKKTPSSKKTQMIDIEPASAPNTVTNTNKKRHQKPKTWIGFRFKNKKLEKMYTTEEGTHKYPLGVIENFFEKMQIIQMTNNELDLYKFRSLGFHLLKGGKLKGQYAVWLTGNWRLTMKFEEDETSKYLLILDIVDYHP